MIAKIFTGKWSSYLSGTIIAFFFVFTLYILDSPAGMTDAYIVMSDYCKESIDAQEINKFPFLDWQTGFLGGIFIGALLAALLGGKWKLRMIPKSSGKGMIASAGITIITGISGGFLVMLGLQVAGDSFLGQWAGAIQLSTSSWVFFASLLVWGVVFTAIIAAKLAKSTADNDQSEKDKKDK